MRKVILSLLLSTTVMYPTQVLADPVSIGTLIINGLMALGGPGSALAFAAVQLSPTLIGGLALTAGYAALSFLTAGGQGQINPGQAKETIVSEETSEVQGVGLIRTAGTLNFGNIRHPNMYRNLLHLKGPISGIVRTFVNDREVVVDAQNRVLSPPWSKINTSNGNITSYLKLLTKIGDGTETAWTELTSDFPEWWSSDHRVRGIFQTLAIATNPGVATELYQKLYSTATYPKIEYEYRASPVYDMRKDSTVTGGSGTQRADDPSTWAWSDNGILCAVYMFMQYPEVTPDVLDWEALIPEADKADQTVTTKTGTEKRCRASGVWPSMNNRSPTLTQMLDSIGAELVLQPSGKFYIRLIDDYPDAEVSFTEDDIRNDFWQSGPEGIERPNVCRVWYYAPEREYEMAEIPLEGIAWATIDEEVAVVGEKIFEVKLPFCPSASQAQRIARRMFTRARADRGSVTLDMSGMAAWGCHYADLEVYGETLRCQITSPRCNDTEGSVEFGFIVIEQLDAWDPNTHEALPPPTKVPQRDDTELETPSAPTAIFSVTYPNTGNKELRVSGGTVSGASGYLGAYTQYDVNDSPTGFEPMLSFSGSGVTYAAGDFIGEKITAKTQAYDEDGSSDFSLDYTEDSVAENTDAPVALTISINSYSNQSGGQTKDYTVTINSVNLVRLRAVRNSGFAGVIYDQYRGPGVVVLTVSSTQGAAGGITFTQYASGGATLVTVS